jgi:hypothetical protein
MGMGNDSGVYHEMNKKLPAWRTAVFLVNYGVGVASGSIRRLGQGASFWFVG